MPRTPGRGGVHWRPRPGYRIQVQTNTIPHSISWQAELTAAGLCQLPKLSGHNLGPTSQPELATLHSVRGVEDLHPQWKEQRTRLQRPKLA